MAIVSAAILTNDKKLAKRLSKKFKHADLIQFDVMDNTFVQGSTLSAEEIHSLKIKHPLEIHLMIKNPEKQLSRFIKLKPYRIIFHVESTKKIDSIIKRLKEENIQVGLALNPETNINKIKPYLYKTDYALVMTVHPGKQSQEFILSSLNKIKQIRKFSTLDIGVDGGVNKKTAKLAASAGATTITSGSYLAKSKNTSSIIKYFKKL